MLAAASRLEYYDDRPGYTTGTAQRLKECTLTAEIKHPRGLPVRFEYRRDWSSVDYFETPGGLVDHQQTFTVGLVYAVSTRP